MVRCPAPLVLASKARWVDPKWSGDRSVPLARSPGPAHGPRLGAHLGQVGLLVPDGSPARIEQEAAHRGIEVEIGCPPSRLPKLRHDLLDRNLESAIQPVVQPELHKSPLCSSQLAVGTSKESRTIATLTTHFLCNIATLQHRPQARFCRR